MTPIFVICAAVGATVLVLQFLLALVGLGGDALGVDSPHGFDHDLAGADHDLAAGDVHGGMVHDGSADSAHGDTQPSHASCHVHHGSIWLFRVLSLRTVVAALAFFGMAGLAAQAADCSPGTTILIAIGTGVGAMYAVYAMLRSMRSLRAEGTVQIQRALGKEATVYLRIPGHQKGSGKIQINLQNRTMEYLATTSGEAIPTGALVVVTDILGGDTVEVQTIADGSQPQPGRESAAKA